MDNNFLIAKAARVGDSPLEWNEIDFVEWPAFRRMVPTVVRLEIRRLEGVIQNHEIGSDSYNTLIGVRYGLCRFADAIEMSDDAAAPGVADLLEQALLSLSTALISAGGREAEILRYVAHRMAYTHNRLNLIYSL